MRPCGKEVSRLECSCAAHGREIWQAAFEKMLVWYLLASESAQFRLVPLRSAKFEILIRRRCSVKLRRLESGLFLACEKRVAAFPGCQFWNGKMTGAKSAMSARACSLGSSTSNVKAAAGCVFLNQRMFARKRSVHGGLRRPVPDTFGRQSLGPVHHAQRVDIVSHPSDICHRKLQVRDYESLGFQCSPI